MKHGQPTRDHIMERAAALEGLVKMKMESGASMDEAHRWLAEMVALYGDKNQNGKPTEQHPGGPNRENLGRYIERTARVVDHARGSIPYQGPEGLRDKETRPVA